jgi:hypothetical protein
LNTTAIYPNRVKDKERVEAMGLPEFPSGPITLRTKAMTHICNEYVRVVYGDHGPYIEIEKSKTNFTRFAFRQKSPFAWYDEWYANDSTRTMLYEQKKTVNMLPNPPKGKYSFNGNRKEGYADYKVGMIYVSPDDVTIETKI